VKALALSVGDPGGIGPRVAIDALAALREVDAPVALFGDGARLQAMGDGVGLALRVVGSARELGAGERGVVDVGRWEDEALQHVPTAAGGRAQLRALDAAIDAILGGEADVLVTGPTAKEAVVLGGTAFVGQTEHLARRCGIADDAVTMLFLGARLRVGLVTTHLALRDVPRAITPERVRRTIRHLADALGRLGREAPRIEVVGLNPHAGEGGLFGDEELLLTEVVAAEGAAGPLPAEAVFRRAEDLGGVVAMFHDQATIASKLLDWGDAVNVTWGLPFVRASVDHGVAYDAAARGSADARGMVAAIQMGLRLSVENSKKG